jgi:hypothetical protein
MQVSIVQALKVVSERQVSHDIESNKVEPGRNVDGLVADIAKSSDELLNVLNKDGLLVSQTLLGEGMGEVTTVDACQ